MNDRGSGTHIKRYFAIIINGMLREKSAKFDKKKL